MKTYRGSWLSPVGPLHTDLSIPFVKVQWDWTELKPTYPIRPRKPNERLSNINWGSRGLGARELAYCILMDLYDEDTAYEHSEQFRDEIVAHMEPSWTLTEAEIHDWLDKVKGKVHA